jgi:hypothetical protein
VTVNAWTTLIWGLEGNQLCRFVQGIPNQVNKMCELIELNTSPVILIIVLALPII